MKNVFKSQKNIIMVAAVLGITVFVTAWQTDNKKKSDTTGKYTTGDTTEPKQHHYDKDEFRMKDLDDAMKELDIEMRKLTSDLKDLSIDISKEVTDAISKIDFDDIDRNIKDAIKEIDLDKIKIDVNKSINEVQEQIQKIDMDKIKIEMRDLQNKLNSDVIKKQIDEAMKNAKEGIEKAKGELKQLKEFTDELQKDGLIDKKKHYSIEWKNGGELYINGKKQPKEISGKYKRFYKKDGFKIEMNNDDHRDVESL